MMWCGGEGGGEHDLPAWGVLFDGGFVELC